MILNDWFITNSLRGLVVDLQEKFDAATSQGDASDVGVNECSRSDPTPKESQNIAGYFLFQTPVIIENSGSSDESSYGMQILPPASTLVIDCMDKRKIRFDSKCKIKTSF